MLPPPGAGSPGAPAVFREAAETSAAKMPLKQILQQRVRSDSTVEHVVPLRPEDAARAYRGAVAAGERARERLGDQQHAARPDHERPVAVRLELHDAFEDQGRATRVVSRNSVSPSQSDSSRAAPTRASRSPTAARDSSGCCRTSIALSNGCRSEFGNPTAGRCAGPPLRRPSAEPSNNRNRPWARRMSSATIAMKSSAPIRKQTQGPRASDGCRVGAP